MIIADRLRPDTSLDFTDVSYEAEHDARCPDPSWCRGKDSKALCHSNWRRSSPVIITAAKRIFIGFGFPLVRGEPRTSFQVRISPFKPLVAIFRLCCPVWSGARPSCGLPSASSQSIRIAFHALLELNPWTPAFHQLFCVNER